MRLVTRSDFDGLACAVLLVEAGLVDGYLFAHPRDLQEGKVEVGPDDILANVPFVPGCGMWFDHHSSEKERLALMDEHHFEGRSVICQSCARVIYDYFGGAAQFGRFDRNGMMAAVDKCDSGQLTVQDILDPQGWVLLSFLMDPRTGLGYEKDYRVSNYRLMLDMIQYCLHMTPDEILRQPDVVERVDRYFAQEADYADMVRSHASVHGNLLVLDLLALDHPAVGNRFKEYALFPDQDISLRVIWGRNRETVSFTCGHSIIKRTSTVNVGELMLKYGGGGHTRVGTCQVEVGEYQRVKAELIEALTSREPAYS